MRIGLRRAALTAAIVLTFVPSVRAQEIGAPPVAPKAQTVEVTPTNITANVGDKVKFSAVAKDAAGNVLAAKAMVWFAAPFDVAGADKEGVVVFHEPGEVVVGAVVAGKPGFAHVMVAAPPVAKIEIAPITQALVAGSSAMLSATMRSANGDPRTDTLIRWTSKSPAIAQVNESGMVTAKAPGNATLSAAAGAVSGEVVVRVVADNIQTLTDGAGPQEQFSERCFRELDCVWTQRNDLSRRRVCSGCSRHLQSDGNRGIPKCCCVYYRGATKC
jgi:plastocyanin